MDLWNRAYLSKPYNSSVFFLPSVSLRPAPFPYHHFSSRNSREGSGQSYMCLYFGLCKDTCSKLHVSLLRAQVTTAVKVWKAPLMTNSYFCSTCKQHLGRRARLPFGHCPSSAVGGSPCWHCLCVLWFPFKLLP